MFSEKFGNTYVLRLDRGEEVMGCLKTFCTQEGIELAEVSGIGACDLAEVGLYDVGERKFQSTLLEGEMEIPSVMGNVTRMDGEVYLHLHITLGLKDTTARGGHLKMCRISGTCELFVRCLPGHVGRKPDPATGLNVFSFQGE